eukprot:TRINITY_DN7594_c0_g1_i1.p1 TRINITY_DN7594_c0_g1~~TRINITY_DN7594_c0_g1_i1.p1  ORF type:complete len:356 (+),score=70.29 TRINITY_DN7594_c0_g1_i1:40-1107(+)
MVLWLTQRLGLSSSSRGRAIVPMGIGRGSLVKHPRRIVIVRKVSTFDFVSRLKSTGQISEEECSNMLHDSSVLEAHHAHQHSLQVVERCVRSHTPEVRFLEKISPQDGQWADLVISVGGDGTFLQATHAVDDSCITPILGVKSSDSSLGYYCCTSSANFPEFFSSIASGAVKPTPLWRMKVFVNGIPHPKLMLNDALFAGYFSADTVKYVIKFNTHQPQAQKSSGVWISTSSGSTAAILSAGGQAQPLTSKKLQFRVRELFPLSVPSAVPLACGIVDEDLEITTRMINARIFMDGSNEVISLKFGDRLTFKPSQWPMFWYSSPLCDENRRQVLEIQKDYKERLEICYADFFKQVS